MAMVLLDEDPPPVGAIIFTRMDALARQTIAADEDMLEPAPAERQVKASSAHLAAFADGPKKRTRQSLPTNHPKSLPTIPSHSQQSQAQQQGGCQETSLAYEASSQAPSG
ncbi:unnamed protein product [Cylindrotheca closterium]|uniref:Uncharacterized protein n=1 Tax=Cylindrotheca closterium TaxID=2856 RepID=A0AAD2FXI7_9STRA|nr:unnamed protein product [Cylindrotheca closterium]